MLPDARAASGSVGSRAYDPRTQEAVVCSAWGPDAEWFRNLRAHPALRIQIGRECYVPEQHFLSEEEALAAGIDFAGRHPGRLRLFETILGWGDLSTEAAMREFVRGHPFVSFRPQGRRSQVEGRSRRDGSHPAYASSGSEVSRATLAP